VWPDEGSDLAAGFTLDESVLVVSAGARVVEVVGAGVIWSSTTVAVEVHADAVRLSASTEVTRRQ
jgi:hypothetical protein